MIKRTLMVLMTFAFVLSIAVIVARGAPAKQKAFTSKAVAETVAPVVETAPVMTGYDVIQNSTTEPRRIATVISFFESARRRLSPTVDWRSSNRLARQRNGFGRIGPVLLL
jgi:hypothetical protein